MGLLGIFNKMEQIEGFVDRVTPKVSFDTFMGSIGDTIDKFIIEQRTDGFQFLGGKTRFTLSEDQHKVLMRADMFFVKNGEFLRKETSGTFPVNMLNRDASEFLLDNLMTDGVYVVEINEP